MKLDDIKKLHQKKYREEFGHFLVEGEHLVLELQKAAKLKSELKKCKLLVTEDYSDWQTDFEVQVISERQMAQISDTKSPQGIIAITPFLTAQAQENKKEKTIYLHEVQDPGNLGTILRSLAWFGNFRCLLSPNSVDPYNPKVVRSSMGAIFHVPIELDVEIASLKPRFKNIATLDMAGGNLSSPDFSTQDCYLFGNEARGIPHDALTHLHVNPFTIRGSGAIESLNLASAVNMCLYELNR